MWVNCLDERYLLTFEFGGCFSIMLYRLVSFSEAAHLLRIFRLLFWTGVDIKNIHNRKARCWKIYTLTQVTFVLPILYISVYLSLFLCPSLSLFLHLPLFFLFLCIQKCTFFFFFSRPHNVSHSDPHYRRLFCRVQRVKVLHLVTRGWSYLDRPGWGGIRVTFRLYRVIIH